MSYEGKIFDVHSHFSVETSEIAEDAGEIGFTVHNKNVDEHLAFMDRMGIAYSVISDPTVKFTDNREQCRAYCRQVNETGARAVSGHPDRLGFAASLPLPFVEDAVEELRYAVQSLGAAAVLLSSNYGELYLGDPSMEPLYSAMDELGCVILLHPTAPMAYPKAPVTGRVLPMFEFIADTTRSVLDILYNEVLVRYQNLRVVIPHSGSCLPMALDRFREVLELQGKEIEIPMDRLYFDLACEGIPRGLAILTNLTDTDHILYGTDYPPVPESILVRDVQKARSIDLPLIETEKVLWGNGAGLFHIAQQGTC